jgi:hypothetical protein
MTCIQRDAEIDLILRSIEDEFQKGLAINLEHPEFTPVHPLGILSGYWISGVYESLRLLKARNLLEAGEQFADLFRRVELVRIALDKHEIASERKLLKKGPLSMLRRAMGNAPETEYVYSAADDQRAYIMPMGLSPRGSITWQPLDLRTDANPVVERRWVSEQIIAFWG